jgi:hypothetical protein
MIKPYSHEEHYDIFCEVLVSHKWPCLPPNLISPIGFVSYLGDVPACFVFVYETVGSSWGIMEWMTVSRKITKQERELAINECINACMEFAVSKNLTLFTSCKAGKLKQRYIEAGLTKTDEGMTNFIYKG